MVEYVKAEVIPDKNILTDKDRVTLIIFSYMINFNLYLSMLLTYNNWFMVLISFMLIQNFIVEMVAGKLTLRNPHILGMFFLFVNLILLGLWTFTSWFNIFIVVYNYLYFKYVILNKKRVEK